MEAEVELKCEIRESKLVEKFLSDGEVKSIKNSQVDKYYDSRDFSFFKQGIFIRVRDGKKLDFKYSFDDDKHEYCQENSFELPLLAEKYDSFNKILKILGLKPIDDINLTVFLKINNLMEVVVIDKARTLVSKDGLNFYIDDVKGLGKFIEIEGIPSQLSDIRIMIANIKEIVKKLNLKKLTTGYVELYLRKNNYNLYRQGKYLLEEDVVK